MSKKSYVPESEADRLLFAKHFLQGLTGLADTLTTITPAELNNLSTATDEFEQSLIQTTDAKAALKSSVELKAARKQNLLSIIRRLAQKIKFDPAFTPSIGRALGTVAPDHSLDLSTVKPEISVEVKPKGVNLISFKKGPFQGVAIYGRREGDSQFVFLARDSYSPYEDKRPCLIPDKPEVRQYRAIYLLADLEVGQFSDVIEAVCHP
ncbi:MAG: hypothetical protein AB1813_20025 [Verrucomicrobiota bacterium]